MAPELEFNYRRGWRASRHGSLYVWLHSTSFLNEL